MRGSRWMQPAISFARSSPPGVVRDLVHSERLADLGQLPALAKLRVRPPQQIHDLLRHLPLLEHRLPSMAIDGASPAVDRHEGHAQSLSPHRYHSIGHARPQRHERSRPLSFSTLHHSERYELAVCTRSDKKYNTPSASIFAHCVVQTNYHD